MKADADFNFLIKLNFGPWSKDERFYDDSVFPVQPKQKTASGRARYAREVANTLLRSASPAAVALGAKLYNCLPGCRCESGACEMCGTAYSRSFAIRTVEQFFDWDYMAMLTVVPSEAEFQHQKIDDLDADKHRDDFIKRMSEIGLSDLPIAGGLDLSLCKYQTKDKPDFWAPHWHCVIDSDDYSEVSERLRFVYRPSFLVPVPVMAKRIKVSPFRALLYCFKSSFFIRPADCRFMPSGKRTEKIRPNSPNPEFEPLMLALDHAGFDGRVLLR